MFQQQQPKKLNLKTFKNFLREVNIGYKENEIILLRYDGLLKEFPL